MEINGRKFIVYIWEEYAIAAIHLGYLFSYGAHCKISFEEGWSEVGNRIGNDFQSKEKLNFKVK